MRLESDQPADSGPENGSDKTWDHPDSPAGAMALYAADTAACVRFFSRLPLPAVNRADDPAAAPDFSRIARAAPLAGTVVALPAAAAGLLLGFTHLPAAAVAVLVAALLAVVTGALHEDGLSDVADGFFGGATRERRLEIMKDSRIGAFGALALALSVALRIVLLSALWQRLGPAQAALVLLGAEALSRALLVWQWQRRPLARPEGLAARFGKPGPSSTRQAALAALVMLVPAFTILPAGALFCGLVVALAGAHLTGRLGTDKIGGVTGDVLGAIQQLSGLGFLAGVLMLH